MNTLLAVLEFRDFAILAWIILVFAGGASMMKRDRSELARIERKLDALLEHHGVKVPSGLSREVKLLLAANPDDKIAAIKLHREQTGLGLAEAKAQIEAFQKSGPNLH